MARNYLQRDLKLLFGKSSMYCAFPDCKASLHAPATSSDDEAILALIAHMVSHSDKGPRANPAWSEAQRNAYENLVLLCGYHHDLVDAQDSTYTTLDLAGWKEVDEQRARERLRVGMSDVRFAELQIICDALIASTVVASSALTAVPPSEKMAHNGITDAVRYQMTIGLMQSPQVESFLENMATRIDATFPNRLRAGFLGYYDSLKSDGLEGDALFIALWLGSADSALLKSDDEATVFLKRSAALAVLAHLFQICEVFEAPTAADKTS